MRERFKMCLPNFLETIMFKEKFWKSQIKSYERLIEQERTEFQQRFESLKEDIFDQIQYKMDKEERKKKRKRRRKVKVLLNL